MLICNSTKEKISPELDTKVGELYATKEGRKAKDRKMKRAQEQKSRVRCRRSHPVKRIWTKDAANGCFTRRKGKQRIKRPDTVD